MRGDSLFCPLFVDFGCFGVGYPLPDRATLVSSRGVVSNALPPESDLWLAALQAAVAAAQDVVGRTAPNPPVGAAWVERDAVGNPHVLAVGVHRRAGEAHAERNVFEALRAALAPIDLETGWLVVTLEPCRHHGRQPPCVEAIIELGIRNVAYAFADPNPDARGGAEWLREQGVRVVELSTIDRATPSWINALTQTQRQLAPFFTRVMHRRPFVVVKTAHRQLPDGSWTMIPPKGQKTFTSDESLTQAHLLRRQSDSILTGSGTVLADQPRFSVRKILDHPEKSRTVFVLDRRERIDAKGEWVKGRKQDQLCVTLLTSGDLASALDQAYRGGALQLLVEAGPTISRLALNGIWDEQWAFLENGEGSQLIVRRHDKGEPPCLLGL